MSCTVYRASSDRHFWAMVGCQAVALPVRAPAPPVFMVAWSTGHAASCVPGDAGVLVLLGALIAAKAMGDASTAKSASASVALPLFPKERPLASEAKDWLDEAKILLPADQRALVDGLTPRSLLGYKPSTVPAVIAPGDPGAAQREALRIQIEDANAVKADQKEAHMSEIKGNMFASLQAAFDLFDNTSPRYGGFGFGTRNPVLPNPEKGIRWESNRPGSAQFREAHSSGKCPKRQNGELEIRASRVSAPCGTTVVTALLDAVRFGGWKKQAPT